MITTNYAGNAFSAAFQAAVAQPMVGYTAKLYYNGSALACDIMRLDLTLGSCADPQGDSDFAVGEVYTSYLEGTLYNVSGSLVGKELDVCVGVDVGSGVYEYAQVATVVVTSAKTRAGVTAFQAAGKLAYEATNTPIGTSGELAPSAVASAIQTATGLTVTIGAFASTSTTVTIESGMTCRAALGAIAKRLGGYACETNVGGVAIVPFSGTATYTLDQGTSTKLPDVEEADFAVDGITVRAEEADYTSGTGRVVIEDASATATTEAVAWGNINGYAFRPGSANTAVLDPRITPFDVLAVTHEGNTVNLPARGIAATYDGGYFGTFSAVGLTDAGEDALMRGPLGEKVDLAQRAANEAMEVAEATNQHFWPYTDGVHVTGPETQDEFLAAEAASFPDYDPDTKPYHNILMNALGILLRTALNNLVSITRSAIAFFDGEGNGAENIVASFGADGAQVGKSDSSHIELGADYMSIVNDDGAAMFNVDMDAGTLSITVKTNPDVYDENDKTISSAGSYSIVGKTRSTGTLGIDTGMTFSIPAGSRLLDFDVKDTGGTFRRPSTTSANGITTATNPGLIFKNTSDIDFTYGTSRTVQLTASGSYSGGGYQYEFSLRVWVIYSGARSVQIQTELSAVVSYMGSNPLVFYPNTYKPYVVYTVTTTGAALIFGTRQEGSANGLLSSSFGEGLIAASEKQAVFGEYNVSDANDTYALIVGNGTADNARSNALAVKWDGTAVDNDGLMVTRSPAKLLWEGTWSAGNTKTVSGLHKYTILACSTGGASYIPAIAPPGTTDIRFYGGYGNATPNQFLYTATFTRTASDSDSMTLVACYESNVHGSTKTASNVTKIWGIC